jgi:hypothetical protein
VESKLNLFDILVRKIQWKNGEWRRQRLIELSDQYHKIVWVSTSDLQRKWYFCIYRILFRNPSSLSPLLKPALSLPPSSSTELLRPTAPSLNGTLLFSTELQQLLTLFLRFYRSSDFSADAANGLIVFETKSYLENLKEMRETLSKH